VLHSLPPAHRSGRVAIRGSTAIDCCRVCSCSRLLLPWDGQRTGVTVPVGFLFWCCFLGTGGEGVSGRELTCEMVSGRELACDVVSGRLATLCGSSLTVGLVRLVASFMVGRQQPATLGAMCVQCSFVVAAQSHNPRLTTCESHICRAAFTGAAGVGSLAQQGLGHTALMGWQGASQVGTRDHDGDR
jgi:hypothetical protein